MKARTTSTQPRGSEGDQAGRTADFIDSIDPKLTPMDAKENRKRVSNGMVGLAPTAFSGALPAQNSMSR